MFNPARLRKDLAEFLLGNAFDLAIFLKKYCAGTCCSLIKSNDVFHELRVGVLT